MSASDDFNWYWLHELGSILLVSDDEAYLRTAINRFYFSAFCEARDYLIRNNIYYNKKLKDELKSNSGEVHSATREIYKLSKEFRSKRRGIRIERALNSLRDLRNEADYQTPSKNFKYSALKSENLSSFVFNTLRKL